MINEFLLKWVPWIFNKTSDALEFTRRVALAAYTEATVEKEWLLLHSVQIPVSSITFPNVASEQIQWRVKVNPTRFIRSSDSIDDLKHISYLGISIKLSGQTIDLTDWINEVKWSGTIAPTPRELFTIWCCETGSSYFHLFDTAELEIITEDGDIINQSF